MRLLWWLIIRSTNFLEFLKLLFKWIIFPWFAIHFWACCINVWWKICYNWIIWGWCCWSIYAFLYYKITDFLLEIVFTPLLIWIEHLHLFRSHGPWNRIFGKLRCVLRYGDSIILVAAFFKCIIESYWLIMSWLLIIVCNWLWLIFLFGRWLHVLIVL